MMFTGKINSLIGLKTQFKAGNCLRSLWCVLLIIAPFLCLAQADISGKVIDKADGKPIPGVTVFLNNATSGTITNKDGSFTLANVQSGQYDLVISCIGYATYYQKVVANNIPVNIPVIQLVVKATELNEVKITGPDPKRARYLKMFINEFLGSSDYARQCKLLNPDVIDIAFNGTENTLTVSTDDYLAIENKATGYKVYYQVDKFIKNYNTNLLYYQGPVRFEELEGKSSNKKRWAKNREAVYTGSSMHFLRAVFQSDFDKEGFKAFRLIRTPNLNRPPDNLIIERLKKYKSNVSDHPEWQDSVRFYTDKMHLPKYTEALVSKPLTEAEFAQPTENKQFMQLQFKDNLYIVYANKSKQTTNLRNLKDIFINRSGTVISLSNKRALFDSNGTFINPGEAVLDGEWGQSGVADLLPINYKP